MSQLIGFQQLTNWLGSIIKMFGLVQVASFLRRELPIRLAHRVQDLEKVRMRKREK